jgi:tetratricopeptide (TPR) repeat protein
MVLYNAAIEATQQGRLEEAKNFYLRAIELDPEYCDAMDNLGQLFRRQGNLEQAVYWYGKSIRAFPENPIAHQNLALAFKMQGKAQKALAEYELLTELDPDNPEGYYGLGTTYRDLGQHRDAVKQLKRAEELCSKTSSPLITDVQYQLGLSYYLLEEYAEARDYLEVVYPKFEDNPSVNLLLGICYLDEEIGNHELAKRYLTIAKELGIKRANDLLKQLDR